MGYPVQTQVDPVRLKAVAAEVAEAAAMLGSALSAAQGRLAPPGQDGWLSATAARAAQESWTGFLTGLGADVSGLATGLEAAANGYARSDQAAADQFAAGRTGSR